MTRRFLQFLGNLLRAGWVRGLLAALLLILVLWTLGPLVAIAGSVVFGSVTARLAGTLAIVFVWGLLVAVLSSRARKREEANPDIAARREREAFDRERLREEARHIRQGISRAVKTVTTSNFYGPTSRSRYVLPWYLVLGASNTGKTSLLLNSGLQFPLGDQSGLHPDNVERTDHVEFLFSNQAVFIDTPGSYTEGNPGSRAHGLWKTLLRQLFRVRPAKALNGVVVCVSMRDVQETDESLPAVLARTIRTRLDEVLKGLRTYVPVYLVFTKCDAVPGFAPFFAHLSRNEREQMFGCPDRTGSMDAETARQELRELMRVLNAQIITKIHQERECLRRAMMFRFPQELAALGTRIEGFVSQAFGPSRYHRPVMFRGFFFSSALSSKGVMSGAAFGGEFSFQSGFLPSQGDYAKGFFLLRLFENFIIPEAGMANADRERLWLLRFRRFGAQVVAGMLLLASVCLLGLSFRDNFARMGMIEGIAGEFEELRQQRTAPRDVTEVLPELAALEKALSVYLPDEDPFLVRGLGLYQGRDFGDAAGQAYSGTLQARFLPLLRKTAADAVDSSLNDLGQLKPALRAYLMLCQPDRMNASMLEEWLAKRWAELYPGRADAQHALSRHASRLIAGGYLPAAPDDRIIARARTALLKTPLPLLAYQQMKEEASQSAHPAFTFRAALGGNMAPFAGDTYAIPYLFTVGGFQEYIVRRCPEIIRGLTDDGWVFGPKPPLLSALDVNRIAKEVRALYFRDYTQHWGQALQELRIPRPGSMVAAGELAGQLCAGVSPAVQVLRELRRNTTFAVEEQRQSGLEEAVEGQVARKGAQKLAPVVGANLARAVTEGALDAVADARTDFVREALRDAQTVRLSFKALDALIDAEGGPAPPLKAAHDAMMRIGEYFRRISASESRGRQALTSLQQIIGDHDETLQQIRNAAKGLPSPVREWYSSVGEGGLVDMLGVAATAIDEAYRDSVLAVYETKLRTQYPFDLESERESSLLEFANFFKKNGVLDSFHETYIRPFADGKGALRPIMGHVLPISDSALAQLNRAHKVQDAFFVSDTELGIRVLIEPQALDVTLKQVDLSHGQKVLSYWHGPVQASHFVWPLDTGQPPEASLSVTDIRAFKTFKTMRGDWAFFRLLRQGKIKRQDGNSCLVELQENGKWAQFLIQFRNKANPFDPGACSFSLPESLL